MMKEKINDLLEFVDKKGKILSVIITIFSALFTYTLKAGAYLFHKGRYIYLNIPDEYVIVDFESTLFSFLAVMIIITVILLVVYIHCLCFDFVKENMEGRARSISIIILLGIVPLMTGIIFVGYLLTQISVVEIQWYLSKCIGNFISFVMIFSVYYYLLMCIVKLLYESAKDYKVEKTDAVTDEKGGKEQDDAKRDGIVKILVLITVVILMFGGMAFCNSLIDIGRTAMSFVSEVSVVEIGEDKYLVAEQYKDCWILKECIYNNDELVINRDTYMIADITGNKVQIFELSAGKSIEDCMVGNDNFEILKD